MGQLVPPKKCSYKAASAGMAGQQRTALLRAHPFDVLEPARLLELLSFRCGLLGHGLHRTQCAQADRNITAEACFRFDAAVQVWCVADKGPRAIRNSGCGKHLSPTLITATSGDPSLRGMSQGNVLRCCSVSGRKNCVGSERHLVKVAMAGTYGDRAPSTSTHGVCSLEGGCQRASPSAQGPAVEATTTHSQHRLLLRSSPARQQRHAADVTPTLPIAKPAQHNATTGPISST